MPYGYAVHPTNARSVSSTEAVSFCFAEDAHLRVGPAMSSDRRRAGWRCRVAHALRYPDARLGARDDEVRVREEAVMWGGGGARYPPHGQFL